MQNRAAIKQLVADYLSGNPGQSTRVQPIIEFLELFEEEELYARTNFTGHITASAYILNQKKDSVLLLRHKFLQRWLQPGGHVELSDFTILSGALREAVEETGISADHLYACSQDIFDIDSHPIPENKKKAEPAHIHHDIAYLFVYKSPEAITIDPEESTAAKWLALADLAIDPTFEKIAISFRQFNCKR